MILLISLISSVQPWKRDHVHADRSKQSVECALQEVREVDGKHTHTHTITRTHANVILSMSIPDRSAVCAQGSSLAFHGDPGSALAGAPRVPKKEEQRNS